MAEMEIRLRRDPATGKQDIHISLRGDEDALPHEHEQMHRALVEKLVGKGVLKSDEVGTVVVTREADEKIPESPQGTPPETERQKQGQSG